MEPVRASDRDADAAARGSDRVREPLRWGRDAMLVALVAGIVYCLARQRTLYGDGSFLLLEICNGDLYHSHHLAYKALVYAVTRAAAWVGVSPYDAAVTCSAVATALGVAAGHVGLRMFGVPRRPALVATAAAGLVPAVVFFASVVEFHGVFFGFAGLAFVAAAWLARTPSLARAALFGVSTFAAYTMHASGHLLPACFGVVFALEAWRHGRASQGRILTLLTVAVAVHAALAFVTARSLARGGHPVSSHALNYVAMCLQTMHYRWTAVFGTLRGDLLVAFLPLSLLWLMGCRRASQRLFTAALAGVLLTYLGASYALTSGHHERGAYLLPVVWPMVLLVARAVPWRWLLASAVVGGTLAGTRVWQHDQPERARAFARGLLAQVKAADAALILSDGLDMHAVLIEVAQAHRLPVRALAVTPTAGHDDFVRDLPSYVNAWLARGKRVFLTDEATALLGNPEYGRLYPVAPRILTRLEEAFTLESASRDGFSAREVLPKSSGR